MNAVRLSLSESHLAIPANVRVIRHTVADFASAAGLTGAGLDNLHLAVSEAVTNVVLHAYPEEPGEVHVVAQLVAGELWVLIADDGGGLDVTPTRGGLGWGLAIITDACEEFTLAERAEGGVEARMLFHIPRRAGRLSRGDR